MILPSDDGTTANKSSTVACSAVLSTSSSLTEKLPLSGGVLGSAWKSLAASPLPLIHWLPPLRIARCSRSTPQ
ncbi:MAG: hypothetical protein H6931_03230 [Burkholderiaceae bacterium]|nr:hypothetical protein [Burkholderiaceae bacterium]